MTSPNRQLTHALVTGAAGFLGQVLIQKLQRAGVKVVGLDLQPPISREILQAITFWRVDLLDDQHVAALWARLDPALASALVVFHLAGLAHAGVCEREPTRAYHLNVTATFNVLEACRLVGFHRIVFPSTSMVYGRPAWLPVDEAAPPAPRTIYAATKLAAEVLLQGYALEYGFTSDVARLGNVYGPGGAADSVAGRLLRQASAGGPLVARNLTPTRDFIFRDDVAEGLWRLATANAGAGFRVFNLSSGRATSIRELALTIARLAGLPEVVQETGSEQVEAVPHMVLDIRRLLNATGWQPTWSLEDGLRLTLDEMQKETA